MQIYGASSVHGPHALQGPHWNRPTERPAAPAAADQVDISPAAEAAAAGGASEIRTDLVNRIRSEIAAGTYETPAKLDAALDRLLNELA